MIKLQSNIFNNNGKFWDTHLIPADDGFSRHNGQLNLLSPLTHGNNRNQSLSCVRLRCANRTYNGFAKAATIFSTLCSTDRVALSSP
jgi:hypothetical protein